MPKFGASIYSISRKIMAGAMTPEEGVRWLGENGAEVIELTPFGIDMIGEPALVDRLLVAAEEVGVPITNYSLNANFLQISEDKYAEEVERLKAHIDIAAQLKIHSIRIDCADYRRPIETNTTENFQKELPKILDTYRILCDYGKQYDLTILLENHGFHVNGSERVRQIMTALDRDNFGHQLDTGNYLCVDDNALAAVMKLMPFATTIHMKDFYIRSKDPGDATQFDCSGSWFRSVAGQYLRGSILGQGDLDMYAIMKVIKDCSFDGDIFVEFEGMEDPLYGTKVSIDNMKRIYNTV